MLLSFELNRIFYKQVKYILFLLYSVTIGHNFQHAALENVQWDLFVLTFLAMKRKMGKSNLKSNFYIGKMGLGTKEML